MCIMCEGATLEEYLLHLHDQIDERGFTQIGVERRRSWNYTIGLAGVAHPELVMAGVNLTEAAVIVNHLARGVLRGESLEGVDRVDAHGDTFRLVPVHERHLENGRLMNMWRNYYGSLGPPPPPLTALQVLVPRSWGCCYRTQWRLDRPRNERRRRGGRRR